MTAYKSLTALVAVLSKKNFNRYALNSLVHIGLAVFLCIQGLEASAQQSVTPKEVLLSEAGSVGFPQISPDGLKVSYTKDDGVLWVAPIDDLEQARAVRGDEVTIGPFIFGMNAGPYMWAHTNEHILFLKDQTGEEDYVLYSIELGTGDIVALTPTEGVRAQILRVSAKRPDEVLVMHDERDVRDHDRQLGKGDVYRINIKTGESELVLKNDRFNSFYEEVPSFLADEDLNLQLALRSTKNGGTALETRDVRGKWQSIITIPMEYSDTLRLHGLDRDGHAYVSLSDFENPQDKMKLGRLVSIDLETSDVLEIYRNDKADVVNILASPVDGKIQAAHSYYLRSNWAPLTPRVAGDFRQLRNEAYGDLYIVNRSADDKAWLVRAVSDVDPDRYYVLNRETHDLTRLWPRPGDVTGYNYVPTHPVIIPSRDGWDLVSYLTLPKGVDKKDDIHPVEPVPLILWVHGGPWDRDRWGTRVIHQFYADRGYAALSINFRGSLGFGAAFIEAAIGEWSGKMHNDLVDGVIWAIEQGITSPGKVGISGSSYGGYSTLVGLSFTPDVFACGAAIAAPADMVHFMESIPTYWPDVYLKRALGNPDTEEGRATLRGISPLNRADRITKPILLAHGLHDPRVPESEIRELAGFLEQKNHPVTYLLYPNEGHDINRGENLMVLLGSVEAFFAGCLGGRYEPLPEDLYGSSVEVVTGADYIDGLNAGSQGEGN